MSKLTSIEVVKAYKTTDDKLFQNEDVALIHQKELNRKISVEEFVKKYGYSGMGKAEIADMIISYANELKEIL